MYIRRIFMSAALLLATARFYGQLPAGSIAVPLGGNSWLTVAAPGGQEAVTDSGWVNWSNKKAVFSTYIYLAHAGSLQLFVPAVVPGGQSLIRCSIGGKAYTITADSSQQLYAVGNWTITGPGYVRIDLQGLRRSGPLFARMKTIFVSGSAVDSLTAFVKNNEGHYFYWGRRGPSVHLNYDLSSIVDSIEWFYSELTVPQGYDPVGSYFMANGFREGYFGMQVNSTSERRILFSVWSPFATDNPAAIPPDQQIRLLKKGTGVYSGEFGNEGAGGQSYLVYPWKAGETYGFLLRALPLGQQATVFTAWFYAPEKARWLLIASFRRPGTSTRLTHLHSFLENFEPDAGILERKAWYHNQWVRTTRGQWYPLSKALFTGDATAKARYRMDYDGGAQAGRFFLRNGGFFNKHRPLNSSLLVKPSLQPPTIPLAELE